MRPPDVDLDRARDVVREVLERPEFQAVGRSWWERVLDRLGDLLDPLLRAAGSEGTRSVAAWFLLGIVLALVVGVTLRAVRRRGASGRRVASTGDTLGRSVVDWLAEADRLAAAGDHRGAVACHLRAGIAGLVAHGLVREVAGRTVGEYRRDVARAAPGRASAFDAAADVFEAVWYAGTVADAGHVAAIAAAVADLDGGRPTRVATTVAP